MIIYNPQRRVGLTEFGIQIPVLDSRAAKTFAYLSAHPTLGKLVDRWHIPHTEPAVTRDDLLRVHSRDYVGRLFSGGLEKEIIRTFELVDSQGEYYRYRPDRAELPLSALFDRALATAAGTYHCCRVALGGGFCYYFGGGTHHARRDRGNGFCLINDIVIALRKLQAENIIETAWVIDVDAHKGDGTAALTRDDALIPYETCHSYRSRQRSTESG